MTKSILTDRHLSDFLEESIKDIETSGAKLFDLGHLLHCIGSATGKNEYHALVGPIASYGSEIIASRPFCKLPILQDETRAKYEEKFELALREGKAALRIIKDQLCSSNEIDHTQIVKAIATLSKHDFELGSLRASILRGRPSTEESS